MYEHYFNISLDITVLQLCIADLMVSLENERVIRTESTLQNEMGDGESVRKFVFTYDSYSCPYDKYESLHLKGHGILFVILNHDRLQKSLYLKKKHL